MMQTGVLERVGNAQDVPKALLWKEPIEVAGYVRRAPKRRAVRKEPERDVAAAVMAAVALRDHMRGGAALVAKREAQQETKTKLWAFAWFWVLAVLLVGVLWAGAHG